MARIRDLKPGFFLNEELAELAPETRLLFAGLWTIADREGRLLDNPRRIKAQIFPYEDRDVDTMLASLHQSHFILRYQVDGERYVQIVNFAKHQKVHPKEAASELPAPVSSREKVRSSRVNKRLSNTQDSTSREEEVASNPF